MNRELPQRKMPLHQQTEGKAPEATCGGYSRQQDGKGRKAAEPPSYIGALRKILELERSRGYTDRAVVGGLDRYLQRSWTPFRESMDSPRHLYRAEQLSLPQSGYTAMSVENRERWVTEILSFLQTLENEKAKAERLSPVAASFRLSAPAVEARTPKTTAAGDSLDSGVRVAVKGAGPSLTAKLENLGVKTVRDLLYFFPRRHLDYSRLRRIAELRAWEEQSIIAHVWEARVTPLGGRRSTEAIVGDETGNIRVVWFNQPYLARSLPTNSRLVISGKVSLFKGMKVFESPEWEALEKEDLTHTGRLVPVYPLTRGLYQRQLRKVMKEALSQWVGRVEDFLPLDIRERCSLQELSQAIQQAHYPLDGVSKDEARKRLAFDELILMQLSMLSRKRKWQERGTGQAIKVEQAQIASFLKALPFRLTGAQHKALREIVSDLQLDRPMARLLQGEVGSGKTVVALASLLPVVASGYQAAFMAPTEILAEQHFENARRLFSSGGEEKKHEDYVNFSGGALPRPLCIALLLGEMAKSQKTGLRDRIRSGEIDIVIGTHALLQKDVQFKALGMAVVDEQHRFGVLQRSTLREKGFHPHLLAITATPIPRTLALTLYGDLDISTINELPPGRQKIRTKRIEPEQREQAYSFLRREIKAGHQAFIICPLIEESESIEAKAAVAEYRRLSLNVFPDLHLGLLHGKMVPREKDEIMERFRRRELDVMVSTPVVEVGIDIPNATVMLIEGAERFGLSQLHQFRGRVGRGQDPSYCLLVAESPTPEARERLDLLQKTQDGFSLAEADLELRGPGEFFGTRQSGLPELRMAKLSDVSLLETARTEALRIFEQDPGLEAPEHLLLNREKARIETGHAEWS